MKEGIVLFAHGSRDASWAKPFEDIAAQLSAEYPVRLAYLEQMKPTLHEARQVLLDVASRAEEHRHDADLRRSFLRQRLERLGKRRPHELEIREAHEPRRLPGEQRGEPLERLRPLRVARAVREKDEGGLRAQWSVARRPS